MKSILSQQNIYTVIWCLYYFQGVLYPEGSIISQGLLALFLLLSIYYFFMVLQLSKLPIAIKSLQYLAILFGTYGLLRLMANTEGWKFINDSTTYFKEYEISILPVFAFYYFGIKRMVDAKWFRIFLILFFLTALVQYFYVQTQALLNSVQGGITNNSGYFIVSLLPLMVFLSKKPVLQYSLIFIIIIFVISAMKRGAIIALAVGVLCFVYESYRKAKGKNKYLIIITGLLVIILGIFYFQYQLANSEYMQLRLEDTKNGDMSHREDMYPEYISFYFNNANIIEFIFGFGADGTLKNMGDFAHEDWIETLMNEGLLGIMLLLYFWISMVYSLIKCLKYKVPNMTMIISIFIIIYFIKSVVSMSINGMTLFSTSALGYVLAAFSKSSIRIDLSDKNNDDKKQILKKRLKLLLYKRHIEMLKKSVE